MIKEDQKTKYIFKRKWKVRLINLIKTENCENFKSNIEETKQL